MKKAPSSVHDGGLCQTRRIITSEVNRAIAHARGRSQCGQRSRKGCNDDADDDLRPIGFLTFTHSASELGIRGVLWEALSGAELLKRSLGGCVLLLRGVRLGGRQVVAPRVDDEVSHRRYLHLQERLRGESDLVIHNVFYLLS